MKYILRTQDTTCTVMRSVMNPNAECDCDRDKDKNDSDDGNCTAEYPCLSVLVNYTVKTNNVSNTAIFLVLS